MLYHCYIIKCMKEYVSLKALRTVCHNDNK